ncbi:Shedu anti-phage system protein SduA domain-containing protein [Pseudomonas nicosulfuronedens]
MSIDDELFEKIMRAAKLSRNLKSASSLDFNKISDALAMKLSYHFDPKDDMKERLEELLESANEHFKKTVKTTLSESPGRALFEKELDKNPEFASAITKGMAAKESIKKLIEYIDDYEPDYDAKEFAAHCINVFTDINSMLLEQDVIPLIKRGIYSEDIASAISVWKNNFKEKSDDEGFWQLELAARKGILERLIGGHARFLQREFHVGSTDIEGKGGKRSDFAIVDDLNKNLNLIEIKTPSTKLLGSEYRNTYPLSKELSGTISQVLIQRNEIMMNFYYKSSRSKAEFEVFSPRCFIIAGNLKALKNKEEKLKAFELQRQAVAAHVTIVTFDELYHQFSTFNQI